MDVKTYITELELAFKAEANPEIAAAQKQYVRGQFNYIGLKSPERRAAQKPFLVKKYLPKKEVALLICLALWKLPERDYKYFVIDFLFLYKKEFKKDDIQLFETLILHDSWWDTIDPLATKLIGEYFKLYPKETNKLCNKWLLSNNIWLQRSAIIFQLHYKDKTDTDLLGRLITALQPSKEFFLNKAAGWALRQYSRTNPEWVITFVQNTSLSNLCKKEALRLIESSKLS